jgi:hypothetical protein
MKRRTHLELSSAELGPETRRRTATPARRVPGPRASVYPDQDSPEVGGSALLAATGLAPDCPARGHRGNGGLASHRTQSGAMPLTRRPPTWLYRPAREMARSSLMGPGGASCASDCVEQRRQRLRTGDKDQRPRPLFRPQLAERGLGPIGARTDGRSCVTLLLAAMS